MPKHGVKEVFGGRKRNVLHVPELGTAFAAKWPELSFMYGIL
jgi:hypothetical protein